MNNKLIYTISELCKGEKPDKKKIQKMIYLLQRAGLDLGMDYAIHFYGPYSAELNECLHGYEADQLIKIDTSGQTHKIEYSGQQLRCPLSIAEKNILNDILRVFGSKDPQELELLATTDYVSQLLADIDMPSKEDVVNSVLKTKGTKFSTAQIEESVKELISRCLFSKA